MIHDTRRFNMLKCWRSRGQACWRFMAGRESRRGELQGLYWKDLLAKWFYIGAQFTYCWLPGHLLGSQAGSISKLSKTLSRFPLFISLFHLSCWFALAKRQGSFMISKISFEHLLPACCIYVLMRIHQILCAGPCHSKWQYPESTGCERLHGSVWSWGGEMKQNLSLVTLEFKRLFQGDECRGPSDKPSHLCWHKSSGEKTF